jgi:hypothetical protein
MLEMRAQPLLSKMRRDGEKEAGLIRWALKNHEKFKKIW